MKKTGLEIVEMIAKGEAPKKIKWNDVIWEFNRINNTYIYILESLDLINMLHNEFEIIEEDKVWKPKHNEEYHYISDDGNIITIIWKNTIIDRLRYEVGNCYKTFEETQKHLEKIKIYTRLKRYALEHNTEKIDWNNFNQSKCFIRYDFSLKNLVGTDLNVIKDINQVYFTSKKLCKKAIKEIGEDNIKKLFEE